MRKARHTRVQIRQQGYGTCDYHPQPQVKLAAIQQQGLCHILLRNLQRPQACTQCSVNCCTVRDSSVGLQPGATVVTVSTTERGLVWYQGWHASTCSWCPRLPGSSWASMEWAKETASEPGIRCRPLPACVQAVPDSVLGLCLQHSPLTCILPCLEHPQLPCCILVLSQPCLPQP